ncbi:MAG: hypothetical protein Fur0022_18820 [Anaerolineales bacterium]
MKSQKSLSPSLLTLLGSSLLLASCVGAAPGTFPSLVLVPGTVQPTSIPIETLTIAPSLTPTQQAPLLLSTPEPTNSHPALDTALDVELVISKGNFRVGETGQFFVTITNQTNEAINLAYFTVWLPYQFLNLIQITVPEACYVFYGISPNGQFMDCPYGIKIPANFTGTLSLPITAFAPGNISGNVTVDLGAGAPYMGKLRATLQVRLEITP